MARAPDPRIEQAKAMYLNGMKLVEIARKLNIPEGTVRRWKCTHKWDSERSDKKANVRKRKKGGQPGNKNAVENDGGAPEQNRNAEKYGFFSKYLPEETREIFSAIEQADPLDLLWHQIQIAYAAIVRAQRTKVRQLLPLFVLIYQIRLCGLLFCILITSNRRVSCDSFRFYKFCKLANLF